MRDDAPKESPEMQAMQKAIQALQERPDDFNEWEIIALRRVAKMVLAFDTLGMIGHRAQQLIILIGSCIAIWAAIKAGVLDWLRGMIH